MLDVAIMIEGQMGLTWPRWQRIAQAVEELGFAGLYRSDHFTNPQPPDDDSLDCWVSLAWLASHTRRIDFGPLVTPVSFRDPVQTTRMAAAIDDLSSGRLTYGLGAGWQEREHTNYGYELLDVPQRFARYEEGLQVVLKLLRSDEPVSFSGTYYRLNEAILLPRPQRPGGPPILIGGNGPQRTLPLAARYADEWNAVYLTPEKFRAASARLDALLEQAGRRPTDVRRSLMTGVAFGRDDAEVRRKLGARAPDEARGRGAIVGTPNEIVEQLGRLSEAGVQRVMLQWLALDDLDGLAALAQRVLPQLGHH